MSCSAHEPFALRVLGDSMAPEFPAGCIVIVDPAGSLYDGCFVVAELDGQSGLWQLHIDAGVYTLKTLAGPCSVSLDSTAPIRAVVAQRAGTRRRDIKHYC